MHRTVLQYQLGEKIGVGGMGEVYKARDTRLNRFVAMKALSGGMSADPDRRRRFIQEAQAVSALSHPNIITIFDIVNDGETQYMVVEYVDGKTLLELIPEGGLPVAQVLRYAGQMAEALSAAHAAGIVHRDLKPSNVMVTNAGLVKVLDFGLAKLIDWTTADSDAPTVTLIPPPLTIEGTLLGTVNYMSPEQAEGKRLDTRSDIFSFGAVLYEMLTGQSAFRGNSTLSTLTAVLRDDVRPIAEIAPAVPIELERIVARCLKKDPSQRFQSMREVQTALAGAASMRVPPPPAPTAPAKRRGIGAKALVAATVLALAVGGGYWWTGRQQPAHAPAPPRPPVTVAVAAPSPSDSPAGSDPIVPPPQPQTQPQTIHVILADGLVIQIVLAQNVPNDVVEGTPIRFSVAEDVRIEDDVVIRKGAAAIGVVADAAKKKVLLFGGKATFRLERVDAVDGQKVPLRATATRNRDGSSKRPLDTGVKKPKELAAAAGAIYSAYIEGPKTVVVRK